MVYMLFEFRLIRCHETLVYGQAGHGDPIDKSMSFDFSSFFYLPRLLLW